MEDIGVHGSSASNSVFCEEIPNLLRAHFDHLKTSGISVEVIKQRGYESVLGHKRLADVGFSKAQLRTPGILIPVWGVDGNGVVSYQYRPDNPRLNARGKPVKYETPKGASNRIDCPPYSHKLLADPGIPLWITEGVKKGDCLASLGQCAINLTGIWNWKGKNQFGGVTISTDFDHIAWNGRQVYLVPDSDFSTNPSVMQAVRRLGELVKRKKSRISVIILPPGNNGVKVGVDDFIVSGHVLEELKALAVPFEEVESVEEDRERELHRNYFYYGNRLYLEIRKYDGDCHFTFLDDNGKVNFVSEVVIGKQTIKPRPLPQIEGATVNVVGMPDEGIANSQLLSPEQLYERIGKHLAKYVDLPQLDLELCVYYVLFTWFYTKVDTLGYLRLLADTGKGKSRTQRVVGDLCFYPVFASGASTFSGIARLNNRWRGTLIMDEADTGGDREHQFVKYLNLGFERGKYYVLSDKQNPRFQEFFDPYSPKIMAMRQPFKDNATEARLLSISPHETTKPDIPILLPPGYSSDTQKLRNELALFALHHFDKVNGEQMISFSDVQIEPRLKQLAMPLSVIFQIWPEGVESFQQYLINRQKEIKKVRSLSWEGSLFNLVYAIAVGDNDLQDEFESYYEPVEKQIQAVTPTMVARQIKSSTKLVTQTLTSVGFGVEWRWVTLHKGGSSTRKRARVYCVPDLQTWMEIVSRYYYSEEDEGLPEIPEILKSQRFHGVPGSVPSVPSVPLSINVNENGTVGTLGTLYPTRQNDDAKKPFRPCFVCGSNDWWQRKDGGWVCGRCHPRP